MDKDCNLPPDEVDTKEMPMEDRDLIVGNVYRKCVATSVSMQFLFVLVTTACTAHRPLCVCVNVCAHSLLGSCAAGAQYRFSPRCSPVFKGQTWK